MTRRNATLAFVLLAMVGPGCSSSRSSDPAAAQEKFGVRMAKMNLWREAMFRFQRAVDMNPEDAMAYNNLAVSLEANGDFEGAAKAYREAMRLDKSNQYIQKNYSRFVEFTTRDRRRQQRRPAAQTAAQKTEESSPAPAATPAAVPPEEVPASAPAPADTDSPAPTAAAPAVTPAPNPAPPDEPPPQTANPPGGQS
ncbi:MAG TPA: tetratricopeptide repeat protein [Thermoanaerobaculia bacterium]|nr:tetratricopeptide repeat protein [Thermoanaerobaculia bacterium]